MALYFENTKKDIIRLMKIWKFLVIILFVDFVRKKF